MKNIEKIQEVLNDMDLEFQVSPSGNVFIYNKNGILKTQDDVFNLFYDKNIKVDILLWTPPYGALIRWY